MHFMECVCVTSIVLTLTVFSLFPSFLPLNFFVFVLLVCVCVCVCAFLQAAVAGLFFYV